MSGYNWSPSSSGLHWNPSAASYADTDGDGLNDGLEDINQDGDVDAQESDPSTFDTDGDGFGDNTMGSLRDDCPNEAGTSTIDLQGCPDSNGDGYSDSYGAVNAHLSMMSENPTGSLFSFLPPFIIFILTLIFVTSLRKEDGGEIVE